ncbi:hypothetical protein [Brachybacterium epidermidis]|uniref:hypothetical protein n=1 Tax=Brachybacterium epidermidis TaxID=2781983 RepID=UPI00269F69D0
MRILPYLSAAGVIALGAFVMHLGQLDDSPGLGGIGLLIMLAAAVWCVWRIRRESRS